MNIPSIFLIIYCVLFFASCEEVVHGQNATISEDSAMANYKKQKHRFEVRSCKFYYNDQQVILDSTKKFEKIFGTNYKTDLTQHFYLDNPIEFYSQGCPNSKKPSSCVEMLNVLMSHEKNYDMHYDSITSLRPALDGYILFNGVLVDANTQIDDLNEKLSAKGKIPLSKLMRMDTYYGITYRCTDCSPAYNCTG